MKNHEKSGKNKKRCGTGVHLAKIIVCLTGILTLMMPLYMVFLSFFTTREIQTAYNGALNPGFMSEYSRFTLLPGQWSLEQYRNTLWISSDFWYYFWNSVGCSLPIMAAICVVGTLGGYAFGRFRFPGKRVLLFTFILFMMMPYQVMIPSQFRVLYEMDLLNRSVSVILPNIFAPFGVYLLYQYVVKLPDDVFEAARIDGAGEIRIFFSIVLPEIKNGIVALLMLTLIDTWNLIEQPLVFFIDEFRQPLSTAINQAGKSNHISLFVSCIFFMIPVFLVFLLGKDQLIEGIGQSIVGNGKSGKNEV